MQKANDLIRCFDGSGDIATWLRKVELVARIKEINDVSTLIPLYLEGPAFSVYDQLDDAKKKDEEAIRKALLEAFGMNKFAAYDAFRNRSWSPGEAVDSFLADLCRLAGLAGIEKDDVIRCAFVCGLPMDVSSQLRASARINEADLGTVVEQARVLMSERIRAGAFVAARAVNREECGRCGGAHSESVCRKRRRIVCWTCGQPGHVQRYCRSEPGNDNGKPLAPAAFPRE